MRNTSLVFAKSVTNLNALAFLFTDPVEELLLREGDDFFISTASFREAADPGCSVQLRESC